MASPPAQKNRPAHEAHPGFEFSDNYVDKHQLSQDIQAECLDPLFQICFGRFETINPKV